MKPEQKKKILIILGLFFTVFLVFTAFTIYEYFYFRDGISVQGTVTDIDSHRTRKSRHYDATIEVVIDQTEVSKRVSLPSGGVSVGGIKLFGSQIKIGDQVEMLAVMGRNDYDIKIVDYIRNPWPRLFWEFFSLLLSGFCFWFILKDKKKFMIIKNK